MSEAKSTPLVFMVELLGDEKRERERERGGCGGAVVVSSVRELGWARNYKRKRELFGGKVYSI